MLAKSSGTSGVTGLSLASSNHVSNSGLTGKAGSCRSLSERKTSFTKVVASGETPAYT